MQRGWRLVALLVCVALVSACVDDGAPTSEEPQPVVRPWEFGAAMERYGPFPRPDLGTFGEPVIHGWVTMIAPRSDLVRSFTDVVDEAEDAGFTTSADGDETCLQRWEREEVPFPNDTDAGEFGGLIPFGAPLPHLASVTGVECRALAAREAARVRVRLVASFVAGTTTPRAAVITIETAERPPGSPPVSTERVPDLEPFDPPSSGFAPGVVVTIDPTAAPGFGGCQPTLQRSADSPVVALDAEIDRSPRRHLVDSAKVAVAVTTDAGAGAVFAATIPAGGGLLVGSAVETSAGSDVLTCRVST